MDVSQVKLLKEAMKALNMPHFVGLFGFV